MTKSELNHEVARRLFGWKWMAYKGRPVRGHPDYHREDIHVRQFMSPTSLASERWKAFFEESEARPAAGDEPLSYCYCSSSGPERVPQFSDIEDYEVLLQARRLPPSKFRDAFKKRLGNQWSYTRGTYARAAIKALDDCGVDTYEELFQDATD